MHSPSQYSRHLPSILRRLWTVGFLLGVWLFPWVAMAQQEEEAAAPKAYVLGYALLGLCVGLGIFVVVRPGKRRFPKIKPKSDDDVAPKGH